MYSSLIFKKKIVLLQYVQPKSCVIMDNAKPLNRIKVMLAERMKPNLRYQILVRSFSDFHKKYEIFTI